MRRIFVSHASVDVELVDAFVDRLLRNGTNLAPDEIFYTSGEDTGISSGEDLIATVRREVGDATLVIALITPSYPTRPVCIAELGAAWGRANSLMPLLLPGMQRTDLDGVLDGMTIRYMDDSAALDELHDRAKKAAGGRDVRAATWNRHKERWLSQVQDLASRLPTPPVVSAAEVEQARHDLDGARAALAEVEDENTELGRQVEALKLAKDPGDVAEALLSPDEQQRFEQLVEKLQATMRDFDRVVRDVLWAARWENGLARPWQDDYRAQEADTNTSKGLIYLDGDEVLWPDTESEAIKRALEARDRLDEFLVDEASEDFDEWFRSKYDFGPSLSRKAVWDALL